MREDEEVFGLLSEGQPVPLEGVLVEADIKDFCSSVTISQRYRNRERNPIEAVYVFPLEEGAAVCGFEAVIDGVHVVGRVKEREEAFEDYDDAMEAGYGAYLLDEERPDVFTASIGNLPPGAEVSIRITYVTELQLEGNDIRFVLPTTISPRYAPAEDLVGVGQTPAEAVNPPVAWKVPYGLELSVALDMGEAISRLESPSHPISVEVRGQQATVRLSTRETAMDRDFVLLVRCDAATGPRAFVEVDEHGRRAALLSFQPTFDNAEPAPSEIVFLVDRSGSMQGNSIEEARNALQLCLRSLPAGTYFNVVGFGSTFEKLFPESRDYDEQSLAQASAHVAAMDADLGGTEILAPLRAILEHPPRKGTAQQLIVLTDGEVSNTDAVIGLVNRNADRTRVFTFGIGAGPSHHLVRGMARAGGGAAEFVYPGERIEAKVLRQLKRILSPALTDVRVEWGCVKAKQAPCKVPPVFSGGRVLVYGFLENDQAGEVRLSAQGPGGTMAFGVEVNPATAHSGSLVAALAARARIRDLEEGTSELHSQRGSRQSGRREQRIRDEIVRLGVTYGLVSRETSFVAIEQRKTPVAGQAVLRRVPVALTTGWGALERRQMPVAFPACLDEGRLGRAFDLGGGWPRAVSGRVVSRRVDEPLGRPMRIKGLIHDAVAHSDPTPSAPVRPLDRVVSQQHADGSWSLNEATAEALGRTLPELEASLPKPSGRRAEARTAWATALAVTYVELFCEAQHDEWDLLVDKAKRWLLQCKARPVDGRDWLEAALDYWSISEPVEGNAN